MDRFSGVCAGMLAEPIRLQTEQSGIRGHVNITRFVYFHQNKDVSTSSQTLTLRVWLARLVSTVDLSIFEASIL